MIAALTVQPLYVTSPPHLILKTVLSIICYYHDPHSGGEGIEEMHSYLPLVLVHGMRQLNGKRGRQQAFISPSGGRPKDI